MAASEPQRPLLTRYSKPATLIACNPVRRNLDTDSGEEMLRRDRWYFGALRTWENGYYLHSRGVLDDELWSGQKVFMGDMLRRDDELRGYYQTNRKYFSKSFTAYLDRLLEAKVE